VKLSIAAKRLFPGAVLASVLATLALVLPAQAAAKITGLDPQVLPGSAITAADAIMANPAQLTGEKANLPERAYGGAGAPSPLGVGDKSQLPEPRGLTGFPTSGNTYAILSNGEINTIASEFEPEYFGSTEFASQVGSAALRGQANDWTVLRLDVNVPGGDNCLALDYRFLSEEYPEFVGSEYNDAFIAEVDESTWRVESGGELVRPNDFAASPEGEPISVNGLGTTALSEAEAEGTYFNAATGLVTTKTPITPGVHSIYLSIFDASDHALDSAIFLDNLRFLNESSATCKPPTGKELEKPAPPSSPGSSEGSTSPGGSSSPPAPPSNAFSLGPSVKFKSGGTKATIVVNVPGPGTLTAGTSAKGATASSSAASISLAPRRHGKKGGKCKGKKGKGKKGCRKRKKRPLLVPATVHAAAAGPVALTLKLSGAGKARLAKRRKVKVPVTITFTPDGGAPSSQVTRVTFHKPKRKGKHGHRGKRKHKRG
jgi:hypothetical protein